MGIFRHILVNLTLSFKTYSKHNKRKKNDPSTSHFLSFRIYGPQCGLQFRYFRWRYSQARRDRHCNSNNDPILSYLKENKVKRLKNKEKK